MRTPVLAATALLVLTLGLAACGQETASPGTTPSSSTSPSSPSPGGTPVTEPTLPTPTETAPTMPPESPGIPPPIDAPNPPGLDGRPAVKRALSDAAGRVGIVPASVEVVGYSLVTWNDGSLGCPQEGQAYTQMQVEGELLLIASDQRFMSYHAGTDGEFTYCADPSDDYTVRP